MKKILLIIGFILIIITGLGLLTIKMLYNNGEELTGNIAVVKEDGEKKASEEASNGEETVGIAIGNIAPDFTLENINGQQESLEDYRGKNIVLNFFRTT
ncbi:AhpC/TSA family protein [Anaerovirgula multivorans]|uniref:AhpC/TSA family protein n=3 Tax=Anaerovirgula multivorans TaxID=312168 RepID=A0A239BI71_9FIRM|nr:AhpC/TSA family protein [Anaerovirgula multivorans]